jgi:uncharacterized protein YdeI (YjbR/CyaY-like superfamily)
MDERLLFPNRTEFREWLSKHHGSCQGVWLTFGKSSAVKTLKADEALEEALCFGWIDGQIKSVDETSYLKRFAPRRKGSVWSDKNRGLATGLIEEGRMAEPGLAAIEQAKKAGTWDAPKPDPISDEQIAMLADALRGYEPALTNFQKMSFSVRRTYTAHYLDAKTEITRSKRLHQIVSRLNENKKPM